MARGNKIPINPDVLKWARETSGYSLIDLQREYRDFQLWETGEDYPTYAKLESLAQKFKRPLAVFFFPEPPQEEKLEKAFRSISQEEVRTLSPHMRKLVRKAYAFQISLRELIDEDLAKQQKKLQWLANLKTLSIDDIAEAVRAQLGISLNEQRSWESSEVALEKWREALAQNGVFVFKDSFEDDRISGFCIYDDIFPIIYINNSLAKNRQIFTVFHELAHILFQESYVDVFDERYWSLERDNPYHEEVRCNAFAASFLVPTNSFLKDTVGIKTVTQDILESLAQTYCVSKEVILRKFLTTSKINDKQYHDTLEKITLLYNHQNPDKKKTSGGGNYYYTKLLYLGDSYLSLVFKNYYRGAIDAAKASAYLTVKEKKFGELEQYYMRSVRSHGRL